MEFTITRDEFLTALQRAQGIVASKGPMPILANILIESSDAGITVFATNLNMGLRGDYRAEVAQAGKASVHAKTLHDIVKEFPEGKLLVKTDDDGRLRITCGKSKFNNSE